MCTTSEKGFYSIKICSKEDGSVIVEMDNVSDILIDWENETTSFFYLNQKHTYTGIFDVYISKL